MLNLPIADPGLRMTNVDDVLQNSKHYHVDFQNSKKKIKQRIKKLNIY